MIKIVSGRSVPVGSTVALVNLCNQMNSRGHKCVLYGRDRWHMDKCNAALTTDFDVTRGDVLIVHNIKLFSGSDLSNLRSAKAPLRNAGLPAILGDLFRKYVGNSRKPDDFGLVMTWQGDERFQLRRIRYAICDKIHYVGKDQLNRQQVKHPHFVCPNFVDELVKSERKPHNVAGVIGSIERENGIGLSIEQAMRDGMETVIVYGYLADPGYYYGSIEPLVKKYRGRIKYAGFVDDKQKLYDSVSDVYCSADKPGSTVGRECDLTNTRFHGPRSDDDSMDNDSIFNRWKDEILT